ncbi:MAG: FHA domain-containing protein [Armatimonadetes bacterium]|nr:FHA domain-containing protein [Armatimonadota bacterium]
MMSEAYLYFLKFGLLAGLYGFLLVLLRCLARDLPSPAELAGGEASSPRDACAERPAAGSAPYWLVTAAGAEQVEGGSSVPLDEPVTIGRAPHCAVRLRDPFCSARHARLEPTAEGARLEDLGSTNGTFVGAEPITAPVVLRPGDRFSIGDVVFELKKKL